MLSGMSRQCQTRELPPSESSKRMPPARQADRSHKPKSRARAPQLKKDQEQRTPKVLSKLGSHHAAPTSRCSWHDVGAAATPPGSAAPSCRGSAQCRCVQLHICVAHWSTRTPGCLAHAHNKRFAQMVVHASEAGLHHQRAMHTITGKAQPHWVARSTPIPRTRAMQVPHSARNGRCTNHMLRMCQVASISHAHVHGGVPTGSDPCVLLCCELQASSGRSPSTGREARPSSRQEAGGSAKPESERPAVTRPASPRGSSFSRCRHPSLDTHDPLILWAQAPSTCPAPTGHRFRPDARQAMGESDPNQKAQPPLALRACAVRVSHAAVQPGLQHPQHPRALRANEMQHARARHPVHAQ
jgi:hypothetical protein